MRCQVEALKPVSRPGVGANRERRLNGRFSRAVRGDDHDVADIDFMAAQLQRCAGLLKLSLCRDERSTRY